MAAQRVLVADLMSGTIKDEIPFTTVEWSKMLCRPGGFGATIPVAHPKCTRENLSTSNTAVYVERDGEIVWGGILWTAAVTYGEAAPMLTLGGEGFWSYFRRRRIRRTLAYAQQDQLAIARALVLYAMSEPGSFTVGLDNQMSGVLRDRVYFGFERKPIGEAIEQLAAVIGGFDFEVSSAWVDGRIVNTLQFYFPQQGSVTSVGFDLGATVEGMTVTEDGTGQATVLDGLGLGEGDSSLIATAEEPAGGGFPRLEESVAWKDISNRGLLASYAAGRLAQLRRPSVRLSGVRLTVDADRVGVGDTCRVTLDDGYFNFNEQYRVAETRTTVDQDGKETHSVTLLEPGAFGG